jgi:hypothetical protein
MSDALKLFPNLVGGVLSYDPSDVFQLLKQPPQTEELFIEIGPEKAEQIARVIDLAKHSDAGLFNLKRCLNELAALKQLHPDSPLRLLGYFALLESLLTHAPKPTDPYDSITRQIKKKLNLLNHRLESPIDYSEFDTAPPEKIWATMYSYRSAVAHGGKPNFDNDHKLLKNSSCALHLVKETAKAVINQALREPQLILDLQEC